MVSVTSYLLSAAALTALIASLAFSAVRLRKLTLPTWQGAPAHLADTIVGVSLLIWLSELLGLLNLLYAWSLVLSTLLLAGALAWRTRAPTKPASPAGGVGVGSTPPCEGCGGQGLAPDSETSLRPEQRVAQGGDPTPATGPAGQNAWSLVITTAVVAVVFAHWGLTAKSALDRGVFNFDSLWYHLPFAVEMAHSHSVTGLQYPETVYVNWAFPQNSELLHAVGILLTHRDTLSLFLNFGWLALAFLAAWCVGRPYGRGHLTTIAAAIVLECHTLVVREPGAAKNDLMAAALLLAAIAILVNAWAAGRERQGGGDDSEPLSLPVGWPLAVAGLATGLAAGTKYTALAMAAALTVAVIALAPTGRRRAAAAWWFLPALAAGGFWYLRNLVVAGNPLPEVAHLGPISLPHPERLQSARPEFSIVHYATDTAVWRHYFAPGLHQALGLLWPLVAAGAIVAALFMLLRGRDRVLRWMSAV
ncbi:MAG TPA: hypothetical protein VFP23_07470, partial [Solirubrobacterales bacterium]|nr:hypothetical protein [Solirubrobacterales bacterium]